MSWCVCWNLKTIKVLKKLKMKHDISSLSYHYYEIVHQSEIKQGKYVNEILCFLDAMIFLLCVF